MTVLDASPATLSERVVAWLSDRSRTTDPTRRSFLQRAALVATAMVVNPFDFVLRPTTAYASVCGDANECSDGWTAFCCTINDGKNTCPPGSYAAGWWKVDDSAFCRGSARYYIDCNRHPTTGTCKCTCADGACDRRRSCCNNFRYGQCNQHIAEVTPVVCRVITCMPPWRWDPSCTTTSLSAPSTRTHSASCLPGEWPSHIEIKYQDMGLLGSVLGAPIESERDAFGGGRYRHYENGFIVWRSDLGAHEIHGEAASRYSRIGREGGSLGYPTTDTCPVGDERGTYNVFEHGRIYGSPGTGAWEVVGQVAVRFSQLGGAKGVLGYPTSGYVEIGDGRGRRSGFEHGDIYYTASTGARELRTHIARHYRALRGPRGDHGLGYPSRGEQMLDGGGRVAEFESGAIYWHRRVSANAVWGRIHSHYEQLDGPAGPLGYPTSDVIVTIEGRHRASFEKGSITWDPDTDVIDVTYRRSTRSASDVPSPSDDDRQPGRDTKEAP